MGGACLATAIRPSLHGQGAPSHAQHSTFCVPHRRNRPASDPEAGENCPLTPPPSLWQCRAMLGETKNQFSLTRVASSTCGRMKSKSISKTTRYSWLLCAATIMCALGCALQMGTPAKGAAAQDLATPKAATATPSTLPKGRGLG